LGRRQNAWFSASISPPSSQFTDSEIVVEGLSSHNIWRTEVTRFAVWLIVVASVSTEVAAQQPEVMTWNIAGETRRALVYAPSKTASGRAPLVFSFHGHGDTVQNFQFIDLHEAFPEAIVAYPQGLPSRRDGYSGWQVERGQDGDRDLALVDAILTSLRAKFDVDDARIYATGFSNGAGLTYLLWAERANVFAAFAPVAGRLRPSVLPKQPRPLLHVAGVRDRTIPFRDQQDAIETARKVNDVTGSGTPCGTGCTLYGSAAASPVMTWIHPGGHEYPIDLSERIARFFRDHSLTP
jgi:polyhydroxybutyrate depolymerase